MKTDQIKTKQNKTDLQLHYESDERQIKRQQLLPNASENRR